MWNESLLLSLLLHVYGTVQLILHTKLALKILSTVTVAELNWCKKSHKGPAICDGKAELSGTEWQCLALCVLCLYSSDNVCVNILPPVIVYS